MVKSMGEHSDSTTTPRAYAGVAADERRSRRRAALFDAALDLLAEGGAPAVTKRAVCTHARLNDRYFYEQFADRDTLLSALVDELTAEGIATVVAATHAAAPDIHSQVHAAADAALGFLIADPRRHALLLTAHSTEALQAARLSTQHSIAAAMAAVARELLPDSSDDVLDSAMNAYVVVSGTLELVAAWMRGEFDTTREHLTDLIARQLLQVPRTESPRATPAH
ncbi:TetR/AcrR family transcriptional regulator [Nocardia rhizosphaerihabitans]|uniref:Transcriptional regulator, TetR family protein n=1 Tax=Nocardia rhizosphaerihabitans TaxID=1691570 RepID=A0ABQ2KGI2_9NOCA|nr:TetR/AcrR family transcriptional regulator [Nocardia rhizosphaerihabitans]GGN82212.1 putative transcriptional regulator, TetR family protein [Nocardia rhizosphaerihabitans]